MSPTYTSVVLASRPTGDIIPGSTFKLKTHPVPTESDLKDGEVVFESRYLSLDPAMRGWLNDTRSYVPPVQIGEIMRGSVVGVVKASKSKDFPVGTYATAMVGWTELAVVKEKDLEKVEIPENGRPTDVLGVLGMTGLTAYFGLLDVGKVKAGDFVVVSGAAGATGSIVGQIAKLKGATVLGIAGSDDKVKWLKELGFDDALNYKDKEFFKKFRAATKDLIDVFFDNVGGEVLDLALSRAKPHARFVICGGISQYNTKEPKGPKNYLMIISMRIRMEGFIVFDYEKQYATARKDLAQWLSEGKIKRKETIIKGGLIEADKALVQLYKGVNTGKLLVEVKAEDGADAKARL
ncbi:NAD(P)-binding protein [Lepidopterella palustris CBS 459.81]|uniref:NAD(P)-binding protein n=1 Tax=Lepidopterella palustris CBS 459.81 TaxID=1314670 RepID=A0A8E2E1L3_9PEZI|nr:NAD(P)-binding protein [Lepidopterella palustris CBS 459.81]